MQLVVWVMAMESLDKGIFIYDASEPERRGFNLIFPKLCAERELDEAAIFKLLSGLRINPKSNAKIRKSTVKGWIRSWHKHGLITCIHGKMRLGNINLCVVLLNEKNRSLIIKELTLS